MFTTIRCSLEDLLGESYIESMAAACGWLGIMDREEALRAARETVDLYPRELALHGDRMLRDVGSKVAPPFLNTNGGAPTDSFKKASHNKAAPLCGRCCMRVGEDGRLYLAAKSEHYHTPLGHAFPGFRLAETAARLGIPNATHNNTRGYVTRLLERELVRTAAGIAEGDDAALEALLASREPKKLNRVINLETGSVACEAGIKMMLARFYRPDATYAAPKYTGRTPVFLVMADSEGRSEANYHGTSVTAQTLRGMWPELYQKIEEAGLYRVVPVRINDIGDFREKLARYNTGAYKTAGFLHEIILMNYGGIRLREDYLREAYALCAESDTPVMADEIQSCMWYGGMFLFRKYGLCPDFVVIGKGFPGGQYPASRILTTAEMDSLTQFGALVTNGQEEIASLCYLITMRYCLGNAGEIDRLGALFESLLRELAASHPELIRRIEGRGHLAAIHFHGVAEASAFAKKLGARCVDASAQVYKAHCPPAVLLKPPVIATEATLSFIAGCMEEALAEMARGV